MAAAAPIWHKMQHPAAVVEIEREEGNLATKSTPTNLTLNYLVAMQLYPPPHSKTHSFSLTQTHAKPAHTTEKQQNAGHVWKHILVRFLGNLKSTLFTLLLPINIALSVENLREKFVKKVKKTVEKNRAAKLLLEAEELINFGGVLSTISGLPLTDAQEGLILSSYEAAVVAGRSMAIKLSHQRWWLLVALNIFFNIAGQTAAVLLARFYYDQGGSNLFIATIVQSAGFPILFIPLLLLPSSHNSSQTPEDPLSSKYIWMIYISLGIAVAGDNFLYAYGLLYLSASTYSLICATQLAFNAIFSFYINSQKLTPLILNSVIVLSFSASLLAVNGSSDAPSGVTKLEYSIGFISSLGASALYSLLLSLMQLSFEKALKKETFSVVLEMQIYTSMAATAVAIAGLFVSGQWRSLGLEMENFGAGKASYVMTLVWTTVCWQVNSVGLVGLIFMVSSLFSNAINTVALAVTPISSVIAFHDKMNGIKIIAMLQAFWGLASYVYQNYLDDSKLRRSDVDITDILN